MRKNDANVQNLIRAAERALDHIGEIIGMKEQAGFEQDELQGEYEVYDDLKKALEQVVGRYP